MALQGAWNSNGRRSASRQVRAAAVSTQRLWTSLQITAIARRSICSGPGWVWAVLP
jgi:hypothetical protein